MVPLVCFATFVLFTAYWFTAYVVTQLRRQLGTTQSTPKNQINSETTSQVLHQEQKAAEPVNAPLEAQFSQGAELVEREASIQQGQLDEGFIGYRQQIQQQAPPLQEQLPLLQSQAQAEEISAIRPKNTAQSSAFKKSTLTSGSENNSIFQGSVSREDPFEIWQTLRKQPSEAEIIRALDSIKTDAKTFPSIKQEDQMNETQEHRDSTVEQIEKLMDFLFEEQPHKFMYLVNKYQVRCSSQKGEPASSFTEINCTVNQLEETLKCKQQEMEVLEIELSEYKAISEQKDQEIKHLTEHVSGLVSRLQASNRQIEAKKQQQQGQAIDQIEEMECYSENNSGRQPELLQASSIMNLKTINENLKNELQFAQKNIKMLQESEAFYIAQFHKLKKSLKHPPKPGADQELLELRAKVAKLQPLANQFQNMRRRYLEMKVKYENNIHDVAEISPRNGNNLKAGSSFKKSPGSLNDSPVNSIRSKKSALAQNMSQRFLEQSGICEEEDIFFIHEVLNNLLKGNLTSTKLYSSGQHRETNPHRVIDNIRGILLVVRLANNRVIGAYTHEPFTTSYPFSNSDNIAFILDVSNRRSFASQSGLNSITYHPSSLIWGFNEIVLKFEEPDVLYSNFCKNHNIYWDGSYKIEQFLGTTKHYEKVQEFQLHHVSSH